MQNQMTQAFRNAKVASSVVGKPLVGMCIDAITKQERIKPTQEQQRGWSAHLSFKTYNELKAQDIIS